MKHIAWLALLLPLAAHAQRPAPHSQPSDQTYTVGVSYLDFHYKEFTESGTILDREDGGIPGVVLTVGVPHEEDNGVYEGVLTWHQGDVAYDGGLQDGTPFKTTTNERLIDVSLRYANNPYPGEIYRFLGGIGYHQWDRDIQSRGIGIGYLETYYWGYVMLGMDAAAYTSGPWSLRLDARLTRTFVAGMTAYLPGTDPTEFDLRSLFGWRVAAPFRYHPAGGRDVYIEPYLEAWELGASPPTTISSGGTTLGAAYEPDSTTRNFGVDVTWVF